MPRVRTAVLVALTVVLSLSAVFLYRRWRGAEDVVARLALEQEKALARATAAEQALAALRDEFTALCATHADLRRSLAATSARSPAPVDAAAAVEATTGSLEPAVLRGEPYVLASLAEAEAVYDRAFAQLDLEALWLLAADLLALGEPGYEKLLELFARLEADKDRFEEIWKIWSAEEIILGPFLKTVAERHEDVLRFGLYISSKEEKALPEPLRAVRPALTDEIGALLLGFYTGGDPAIWSGYLDLHRQKIEAVADDDAIHALAAIPTEEATDYLLELAARPLAPGVLQAVVRALAWKRSERAVPFLLDLRDRTADEATRGVIDAALRHLRR